MGHKNNFILIGNIQKSYEKNNDDGGNKEKFAGAMSVSK